MCSTSMNHGTDTEEALLHDCLRLDLQSGEVSMIQQAECEIITQIHYYSCMDASAAETQTR